MNIEEIKKERLKWLKWKNIAPLRELLKEIPKHRITNIKLEDTIEIEGEIENPQKLREIALKMRPWRKGPFKLFSLFIDSEWRSHIKYNLLKPFFNLQDKTVADVGCNNGYYMFRMLKESPKEIVGFDPSPLFMTQFQFIDTFVKSNIRYELLGVEHLKYYGKKFDTIFCLGVLYHRSDPILTLKSLKQSLNPSGEVFLDTFFIESDQEIALIPKKTYSKIPNVHFIPSIKALQNWCEKAGFKEFEILAKKETDLTEQRKTEWIEGESLNNFLDPSDPSKTVEGYPAPRRVYAKVKI